LARLHRCYGEVSELSQDNGHPDITWFKPTSRE
jgi:hypothetical protein